ncbi:MAG: STAS domain-containing protein [Thermodesulfovibrionales bacterium]|nr:STAS domain-containing protein [Thermodesulfovibrionales bacterium]
MEIGFNKEGDFLVISISGRIDAVTSTELEKALIAKLEVGEMKLIADMKDVEYISSAGLRVFLLIAKKLNTQKGKLVFFNLQKMIEDVFKVSGFYSLFGIFKSKEEAIKSF